jgi:hypothetical protein
MSSDRFEVLDRLAPLFEAPEPSFEGFLRRRRRKHRNQRITVGVVGVVFVAVLAWLVPQGAPSDRIEPADTTPTTGPEPSVPDGFIVRQGFIGMPPVGAQPSTPERGEIVLEISPCTSPELNNVSRSGAELFVFADGRLIWTRNADHPQGANPLSTGLLEQRLTPEGVELMRSELLDSDLLRPDEPPCEAGWYRGHLHGAAGGSFSTPANEFAARITDPASWLPESAWEDREIRAYVPSEYTVELMGVRARSLSGFRDELPPAAAELVRCKNWEVQSVESGFVYYIDFTTDEARALATAVDDAGFEQDESANAYHLEYSFVLDYQDSVVHIEFYPQLPGEHATLGGSPDRLVDLSHGWWNGAC